MKGLEVNKAGAEVEGVRLAFQVTKATGRVQGRYVLYITPRYVHMPLGAKFSLKDKRYKWFWNYDEARAYADRRLGIKQTGPEFKRQARKRKNDSS